MFFTRQGTQGQLREIVKAQGNLALTFVRAGADGFLAVPLVKSRDYHCHSHINQATLHDEWV